MIGRVARMRGVRLAKRDVRTAKRQDPPAATPGQDPTAGRRGKARRRPGPARSNVHPDAKKALEREKPASELAGSRGAAYPYAPWEAESLNRCSLPVGEWFPTGPRLTSPRARELGVIFGGGDG